jgi:aspartate racemase
MKDRLGGLHSAKTVLYSVDFAEIETLQHKGKCRETAQILSRAAKNVEAAGADFIVLCTNTMHKIASDLESAVRIPLLHIADATAREISALGLRRIGLLVKEEDSPGPLFDTTRIHAEAAVDLALES